MINRTSSSIGRLAADERASEDDEKPPTRPRLGVTNQALVVGILAAVAGWFLHILSERNERDAALPAIPTRSEQDLAPTMVTVAPVSVRSIDQTVDVIGTLNSFEEITISSEVDGKVQRIHGDVASRVECGGLLVEIEPDQYRLEVEQAQRSLQVDLAKLGLREVPTSEWDVESIPSVVQAQSRLTLAENRLQRLKKLAADRAASESDLDAAVSEYEFGQAERDGQILAAKASLATIQLKQTDLEIAHRKLTDTRIVAPTPSFELPVALSNGSTRPLFVISQRSVSEGAYVRAGTAVLTLAIDSRLKLKANVPEKLGTVVELGQVAAITSAALTEPMSGKVSMIHPTVDPTNRTFEIEIQVDNSEEQLKPGNFAKATVQIGRRENSTTVPLESIVTLAGIVKVFIVEEGKAHAYSVRLGSQTNEWVEILDPPFPNDACVITSGHAQLATGSLVQVRESNLSSQREPSSSTPAATTVADHAHPSP